MLWVKVLALEEEHDQDQREIVGWKDTEEAAQIEVPWRGPCLREEESPGEGQKEQQARKDEEKRYSISAKEEKGIQHKVFRWCSAPYLKIAWDAIDMKPDNDQTSEGAYAV